MKRELNRTQLIERSIITTYRKELWKQFNDAISRYELIEENDKIMVCISGGKDSFLLAECFKQLKRSSRISFDVRYVCMNPGYNKEILNSITNNAELLDIDLKMFETDIFDVSSSSKENPCFVCAKLRRGALYKKAVEYGCNKIALGHHFNDVIETSLISMFYSSEIKTMIPKLYSDNKDPITLIRPLYLVKEDSIIKWVKHNELKFIDCECPVSKKNDHLSVRNKMKHLIKTLKKDNPNIEENIFNSLNNVNLNNVLGYKLNEKRTDFLELYNNHHQ